MTHQVRSILVVALVVAALSGCAGSEATPSFPTARSASATPVASATPTHTVASATPLPTASPRDVASDVPSRVVIPELGIDLPVVSGDLEVPGSPPDYPLCDVAQYLTTYRYPGRPGTTTWIYAHAREGMFLPLLEASRRNEGAELIGRHVEVYSTADRRYTYEITRVLPHATDRSSAADVPGATGRLVLQTSEGPHGTIPKLQVVAERIGSANASPSAAQPKAEPRGCFGA